MLRQDVPTPIQQLLETHHLNGLPFLLATTSDLSLSGDVRPHWLIATSENVAVVTDGPESTIVGSVPLNRVEKFRSQGTIGSGFLQAWVDGSWVDLVRYSNALTTRFHRVAGKLEDLRTTGEVTIRPEEEVDTAHCPNCGLRLPTAGESCPRCLPRRTIAIRLAQMLMPYWPSALAMCLLMLLGVATELAPPKLQQYLVDEILRQGQVSPASAEMLAALSTVVMILAGTRVVLGLVNWAKGRLANRVGVSLTFDLRAELVRKLHALDVSYYDKHQVSSLTSRVAHDTEVLHSLLQQFTGGFLLQIVQVTAVGAMLFTLNPRLALYTLIPAPLVIAGSLYFWRRVYPRYYRYWDSATKQSGTLASMLNGIRVVKAFAQEPKEFDRFSRSSEYLRHSRVAVETSTATFSSIMALIFSMGGLIVWYVGGRDVLAGQMTLGSLMAFLAYLAMFYAPLATLSQLTTWLTNFLTGCQRVFELLDAPTQTREPVAPQSLPAAEGEVVFEHVTFGYERHRPVLKDVNFTIKPGERIGIVGRSGSGKTTLVNLISRFYDVDEGRVMLDGIDLRDLAKHDLRSHVGVVLQEPFLFRGTIRDNLVYGRPDSTREATLESARAAQAHDFILRTPLGYDTWLGERGAGLSGGEKQRMSIARALLYNPKVLILDEATSSVDTESEKSIQEALRVLTRGRTTLAIAHRLSTLRDSDRILVFDQGRLIEQGSHDELMTLGGKYARLVSIQTRISRNKQFELALNGQAQEPEEPTPAQVDDVIDDAAQHLTPRWLQPGDATLRNGPRDSLTVELPDGESFAGVFAVRCFPASAPNDFISLRMWDRDGNEQEIGILRQLDDWSPEVQQLIDAALSRRYLLRTITGIDAMQLEYGYLIIKARSDQGPVSFTMRWSQSQVQDFGESGKILLDLEDNRFIVPDVNALPRRERELLLRYIYW